MPSDSNLVGGVSARVMLVAILAVMLLLAWIAKRWR